MRIFLFSLLPLFAVGFNTVNTKFLTSNVKDVMIRGSTEPLPNFDPLNLSTDNPSRLSFFREAELKHGRLAMIAALSIPLTEFFTHKAGIFEFQQLPANIQMLVISGMFVSEFSSMFIGWKNPFDQPFTLNEDYQPGDLGFNLYSDFSNNGVLLDKELNNGRLAMVAAAGMIGQELVTRQPLF